MHRYQTPMVIGWVLFASAPVVAAAPPTFEKDIRPILKAHCFDCHGEGEKLKGGLDLRLQRLMPRGSVITEEERAFWSFQPIRHPKVLATKPKDRARTPIDAFLLSAMAKRK